MDENIFAAITSVDIELPLQILNGYVDQFNNSFVGKLAFELKSKMEDDSDPWASLDTAFKKKEQDEKSYVTRAYIIAPGLSNYRLLVLKLSYKISKVYPCHIENILDESFTECDNPERVKEELEDIFKSKSFKSPVSMLLSQLAQ